MCLLVKKSDDGQIAKLPEKLERAMGFELTTPTLAKMYSTLGPCPRPWAARRGAARRKERATGDGPGRERAWRFLTRSPAVVGLASS